MSELNDAMNCAFDNAQVDIESPWQLGKICQICGKCFAVYHIHDPRMMCPECLHRLKKLLYPEEAVND